MRLVGLYDACFSSYFIRTWGQRDFTTRSAKLWTRFMSTCSKLLRHQRTELRINKRDVHELHTAKLLLTRYNHSATRKIPRLLRSSTIAGSKSQHYFFNIHLNITTPSMPRSYKVSSLYVSQIKPYVHYSSHPASPLWFYHLNDIWQWVIQTMKLHNK